jgi:DeoR family fructose operon transcriptional repressor
MLPEERQARILEMLQEQKNGMVTVSALSEFFGISGMTVRRDLDRLEEAGMVKRVHGGAISNDGLLYEKPFLTREDERYDQKTEIGHIAAQMIRDGQALILDAGTTTREIARNLTERRDLTVVTNSIPVAIVLSSYLGVQTIMLGGMLKHKELCMVGPPVVNELSQILVDKLFLSASGFSLEHGATDPDIREAQVKKAMIPSAKEVILVVDSAKYGRADFAKIVPIGAIQKIVTDDGLPAKAIAALEAEGVQVLTPARVRQKREVGTGAP